MNNNATSVPDNLKSARVMIVDDEPTTLIVIQAFLEAAGYRHFIAVSESAKAMKLIESEKPDVVLLDLLMPKMSGLDILKTIRANSELEYLPVIVLTSAGDSETKLKVLDLGAADFLAKPISASELVLRLRNTLTARAYLEAQRAMIEAEEASRAKSAFLAAMSHEIRTPMNGIIGMTEVLRQSTLKNDQMEMVNLIRDSAYSLLGIINDVLDFSKIEAGKLQIDQDAFAVEAVAEGVGALLIGLAWKKEVTLLVFVDPAIPAKVIGDALRVRQVLINLVNNAIKFSAEQSQKGRVSLRVSLVDRSAERVTVQFAVTDNGIGMSQQMQRRLFTPFTQEDASTTRRFGGTGLGLAIAGNLVKLMGGEITVQSAPGAGATFKVRLPFAGLPAEAQEVSETESVVAGLPCTVVGAAGGLADDLAAYLKHAQAEVVRVPDLASAMARGAGRSRTSVWVVDVEDARPSSEEMCAIARAQIDQGASVALIFVQRGRRYRPRALAPDLITLDGNVLYRQAFLRTVAAAAGRMALEAEAKLLTTSSFTMIAPSREEALQQGRLILVAEDDATNQKVIVRQLALLGYTADVAADGREALQLWQSGEYALLLTDLSMPNMDGYDLTKAIRAGENKGQHLPVIALTANARKGEAENCRALGMDDYQNKPLPLTKLKELMEKWLPVKRGVAGATPAATVPTVATQRTAAPADKRVLEELVGNDPEVVNEFLQDYRNSMASIVVELRAACAAKELKEAVVAAHKLKSSARALGAFALAELCESMEHAGKAGDHDILNALLPQIETETAVVIDYLDSC